MHIILVTGTKGGSGKSTIAHLLALGLSLKGKQAVLLHTDDREAEEHKGRPYAYVDCTTFDKQEKEYKFDPQKLTAILKKVIDMEGFCIIDGGGNRPEFDKIASKVSELDLIACAIGGQNKKRAFKDLENLKDAKIIINNWTNNIYKKIKAKSYISDIPQDKILSFVLEIGALERLTEDDLEDFKTMPTKANGAAKGLARDVLNVFA